MPLIVWAGVAAVGALVALTGWGVKQAGEGVDEAGNGALKLVGAGAVTLGLFMIGRKKRLW